MIACELYPVIGRNTYCGPGVISALTGMPSDVAAAALRDVTGRRAITRCKVNDVLAVLLRQGLRARLRPLDRPVTVQRWVMKEADRDAAYRYVLRVSGHLLVAHVDWRRGVWNVGDNSTIYPIDVRRYSGRMRRVTAVWEVWQP